MTSRATIRELRRTASEHGDNANPVEVEEVARDELALRLANGAFVDVLAGIVFVA
jgi:hypothetical protein